MTKLGMIISRWSSTLMKISRIMFINSKYLSDGNWGYRIILRKVLVGIRV